MRHLLRLEPRQTCRSSKGALLGEQLLGFLWFPEVKLADGLDRDREDALGRPILGQQGESLLRVRDRLSAVETKACFPEQERALTCLVIRIGPAFFSDMKRLRGFLPSFHSAKCPRQVEGQPRRPLEDRGWEFL